MLVVTKLWGHGVRKNISECITALDGRQTKIRPFGIFGRARSRANVVGDKVSTQLNCWG